MGGRPRSFRGLREGRGAGFLYRSRASMGVLMRRPFESPALLRMRAAARWPVGVAHGHQVWPGRLFSSPCLNEKRTGFRLSLGGPWGFRWPCGSSVRRRRCGSTRGRLTRMTDAGSAVFGRLLGLLHRLFQASTSSGRSTSCRRVPVSGLSSGSGTE